MAFFKKSFEEQQRLVLQSSAIDVDHAGVVYMTIREAIDDVERMMSQNAVETAVGIIKRQKIVTEHNKYVIWEAAMTRAAILGNTRACMALLDCDRPANLPKVVVDIVATKPEMIRFFIHHMNNHEIARVALICAQANSFDVEGFRQITSMITDAECMFELTRMVIECPNLVAIALGRFLRLKANVGQKKSMSKLLRDYDY